ncbi:MAG: glycosyltransferase family 4 protein [Desulfuromonas sp.]|nr:glycosyltransferase family 4 protein [Desulfuromonas sp.]
MLAPTPYFSDRGCHVRIYEEAKALRQRGHQVEIVTYHLGRDHGGIPVTRTPWIPWYRKTSAGPSWHKPYLDVLLFFTALRRARYFRPDVIHAHLHEGAFVGIFLKPLVKAPLLFDCQGSLCGELLDHGFMRRGGFLHRVFACLERWIVCRADTIVTSATSTAEAIRKAFPEVNDRLFALPDAVDIDAFRPMAEEPNLREQLGIPNDKRVIVYLGAMTDYQGVGLLLEVLARLAAQHNDFHGLLMGYPEAEYVRQAEQLGLKGRVTFTGRIDYTEAPRYLSLGDIAVSPKLSASEANGKLLNYLACGLPCVVFDTPVNRELLEEVGVYAVFGDPVDFASRLAELLDDPAGLPERSRQARNHAVEHHSWEARIGVLEGVYAGLI